MKRRVSRKVIDVLTEVYTAEIGAIGIYMDQHTKCADMGYKKLSEMLKDDALHEMKHAEDLAERILFLGSNVPYQKHMVPVEEEWDIKKMIETNINIEIEAIDRLNKGIATCFKEGDNGSRMLLEHILREEEEHLDHLQKIYENIERYGDQYITTHLM